MEVSEILIRQAGLDLAGALDRGEVERVLTGALVEAIGVQAVELCGPDDPDPLVVAAVNSGSPRWGRSGVSEVLVVPCVAAGRIQALVRARGVPLAAEGAVRELAGFVGPALVAAERHDRAVHLDGLTGVLNRRCLDRDLDQRRGSTAAVIMLDIDHFKRFNDDHGHAAGDAVLAAVAQAAAAEVRPEDRVYRYGGEELTVLLADAGVVMAVAERIREAVARLELTLDGRLLPPVTVSAGVAVGDLPGVVERADQALYRAKEQGRNQVVSAHASRGEVAVPMSEPLTDAGPGHRDDRPSGSPSDLAASLRQLLAGGGA